MLAEKFLSGRTAYITGGLSGMGLQIAKGLASSGANVAAGSYLSEISTIQNDGAYYPGQDDLNRVFDELKSHGHGVYAGHVNVRDVDAVAAFTEAAEKAVGPADILVNAAGTIVEHGVEGHPEELWLKSIDTNLNGAFRMIRACLPGMKERRWGRIITISSMAGTTGAADSPAYCASKAGLLGLTRAVALEGAPHGVSATTISPTWVETEMMRRNAVQVAETEGKGRSGEDVMAEVAETNPQNRIIQPREIAAMAVHLCRDESLGVTMADIHINGGSLW